MNEVKALPYREALQQPHPGLAVNALLNAAVRPYCASFSADVRNLSENEIIDVKRQYIRRPRAVEIRELRNYNANFEFYFPVVHAIATPFLGFYVAGAHEKCPVGEYGSKLAIDFLNTTSVLIALARGMKET